MTDDLTQRVDAVPPPEETPAQPAPEGGMGVTAPETAPESGMAVTAPETAPEAPVEPPIEASTAPTADAPGATADSAATLPVAAAPAAAAGPSRKRWVVALAAAVVAVAVGVGAVLFLNAPSTPVALSYVPADSVMVVEIRPELPGDQLQQLGNFLAKFPGFADQSTLALKLDEAFAKAFAGASGAGIDYATDVKPWLNGPLFIAARPRPAGTATSVATLPAGFLLSATTNGQATCAGTFKDQKTTSTTYQGTDLLQVTDTELACAIQGRQGLLGDIASVKAALDAKAGGTGMDRDAGYATARKSMTGDRLATMYINGKSYFDVLASMTDALPGGVTNPLAGMNVTVPAWVYAGIRAENNAIVMDTVAAAPVPLSASPGASAGPSMLPIPPAHPSVIAGMVPSDAVFFLESQGAGIGLQNMITQLRAIPEFNQQLGTLDGIANLDTVVGWVDDAGIVVTGGTSPSAAIILVAKDEAAAAEKGGSIGTIIGLAGLGGSGIQTSDATVNGVKITTITITDTSALFPAGSVPGVTGPIELSYAVKGKALLFGVGKDALAKLVSVQAGSTLQDDAAFKRVAARGIKPGGVTVYLAVPKLIELVESIVPESERGTWTTDVRPYVVPFESLYFVSEADGDLGQSTFIVTVTAP